MFDEPNDATYPDRRLELTGAGRLTADELLTTTRSIRRRLDLDSPVELSTVEECLRIALQAPSGSNEQNWHWIVVTSPEIRRKLGELYLGAVTERRARITAAADRKPAAPGPADDDARQRVMRSSAYLAENLGRVPVHIIPCVRSSVPEHPADEQVIPATRYASIFPAVWSLQLALRSRGYGSCLTTAHLVRHEQAAELLGIPAGYSQACLLPVARLTGDNHFRPAPRKPLESVMSYDQF
jgi:nitroreductase